MDQLTEIAEKLEEIAEDFEFLGDWEERYRYLIDLGDQLPGLPDSAKTEEFRVQGCTSNVWLVGAVAGQGDSARLQLTADSDARIVRGLVWLLLAAYQDQRPEEVLNFPIESFFARLGLDKHLSRSRSNGLRSMVARIRALAEASLDSPSRDAEA